MYRCLMCLDKLAGGHLFVCSPECYAAFKEWQELEPPRPSCNTYWKKILEEKKGGRE